MNKNFTLANQEYFSKILDICMKQENYINYVEFLHKYKTKFITVKNKTQMQECIITCFKKAFYKDVFFEIDNAKLIDYEIINKNSIPFYKYNTVLSIRIIPLIQNIPSKICDENFIKQMKNIFEEYQKKHIHWYYYHDENVLEKRSYNQATQNWVKNLMTNLENQKKIWEKLTLEICVALNEKINPNLSKEYQNKIL